MSDRGLHVELACIWEATARKPGNVHRYRDFHDTNYLDFLVSAAVLSRSLCASAERSVGTMILEAVQATRNFTGVNTNLGIILLLAPLVKAGDPGDLRKTSEAILDNLTVEDSELTCRAITSAQPAGLGKAEQGDVSQPQTLPLRQLMVLAQERDLIARQYAGGFREVFETAVPAIQRGISTTGCLEGGIVFGHLTLMAAYPDSLIARKRGKDEAQTSARRAEQVLQMGWPGQMEGKVAIREFDSWLREEGNARNPGTTADLIAAALYVMQQNTALRAPFAIPWTVDGLFD